MRRFLPILCLLVAACGSEEPPSPWHTVELGTDARFRDIFFVDARNGWMVGEAGIGIKGGMVARTRDGGETWEYQSGIVPDRYRSSSVDLNAVHFVDSLRGCIAAESGTVLVTADGGETWDEIHVDHPVYMHIYDVDFIDGSNGWMVGRIGVLRTSDAGQSWERVDENLKTTGWAIDFTNGRNGWIVGKFAQVDHSTDGGVTWTGVEPLGNLDHLNGDEKPFFTSVCFVDDDHGWVTGYWREHTMLDQIDHAVIIHTADGGKTWEHQLPGVEALMTSIVFADTLRGWAVGYSGGTSRVLVTEDGGFTWLEATSVFGEELKSVCFRDGYVWAVGKRARQEPQRLLRYTPPPALPVAGQGVGEGQ